VVNTAAILVVVMLIGGALSFVLVLPAAYSTSAERRSIVFLIVLFVAEALCFAAVVTLLTIAEHRGG
jgi:hypothetical protein